MTRKRKAIVNYDVPCALCGDEIDERLSYQEHVGWVAPLHSSGTSVIGRKPTGRVACYTCVSKIRSGVQPGQESLL